MTQTQEAAITMAKKQKKKPIKDYRIRSLITLIALQRDKIKACEREVNRYRELLNYQWLRSYGKCTGIKYKPSLTSTYK